MATGAGFITPNTPHEATEAPGTASDRPTATHLKAEEVCKAHLLDRKASPPAHQGIGTAGNSHGPFLPPACLVMQGNYRMGGGS